MVRVYQDLSTVLLDIKLNCRATSEGLGFKVKPIHSMKDISFNAAYEPLCQESGHKSNVMASNPKPEA